MNPSFLLPDQQPISAQHLCLTYLLFIGILIVISLKRLQIHKMKTEKSALLKPWQECDGWSDETHKIETGLWKLFLHYPVGVGGRVAGHAHSIVDQREDEVNYHTPNYRDPVEQCL